VEVGEDEARAARTERTPFRRNPVRPTVPPPSIHMVRPVRNSFYFLLSYNLLYVQKFLAKVINQSIFSNYCSNGFNSFWVYGYFSFSSLLSI
jgi:hypothetical protein